MSPPTLFFFFKIVLPILGPLSFHTNFKMGMTISAPKPGAGEKKGGGAAGILIGIILNHRSTWGVLPS